MGGLGSKKKAPEAPPTQLSWQELWDRNNQSSSAYFSSHPNLSHRLARVEHPAPVTNRPAPPRPPHLTDVGRNADWLENTRVVVNPTAQSIRDYNNLPTTSSARSSNSGWNHSQLSWASVASTSTSSNSLDNVFKSRSVVPTLPPPPQTNTNAASSRTTLIGKRVTTQPSRSQWTLFNEQHQSKIYTPTPHQMPHWDFSSDPSSATAAHESSARQRATGIHQSAAGKPLTSSQLNINQDKPRRPFNSSERARNERFKNAGERPPLEAILKQIDGFLPLLQEMGLNIDEDIIFNYKNMMTLYNERLRPNDSSVTFGNMMSVLRREGMILAPAGQKSSVVTFVGKKVALFIANKDHAAIPDHSFNLQKPGNSTSSEDGKNCTVCGVENDEAHAESDKHQFLILYQRLKRQRQGETPGILSGGGPLNMVFQGKDTQENRQKMILNVLQSESPRKIAMEIYLTYCDEDTNISNVSNFILGSQKLTFGSIGNLNFSSKRKRSTLFLELDVSSTMSEEFIVVLKFKKLQKEGAATEVFLMKKMVVRVDDDFTREDGEVVDSRPSVQSEELDEKSSAGGVMQIDEEDEDNTASGRAKLKKLLKDVRKLEHYPIPKEYVNLFNRGLRTSDKMWTKTLISQTNILEDLDYGVTPSNYSRMFSLMLFLEEHQMMADLKTYTMKEAFLERDHELFELEVPGLAENRPSVLKYDKISITLPNGKTHDGAVKCIQSTIIQMKMQKEFLREYVDKMKVTVSFSVNRNSFKVMHRALELMRSTKMIDAVCFPETHSQFVHEDLPVKTWFNRLVGDNPEQCQAVQNIVSGTSKPAPYLVFGPPGTGKTVTIVESIKQIWFLHEDSHILATAPSNSAADLLAERIIENVPASQVLRLYSLNREYSTVPETLFKCSNFDGPDSESYFPDLKTLLRYRVIVCTLICAGRLYTGGFEPGFFSHIFVDECGHAMEPTAIVPIAGFLGPPHKPTQVVLSGDPKQLGPVVRSPVAKIIGLGKSWLGRLMENMDIYCRDEDGKFNPNVLTKLVATFRSHPVIFKVPNELFYDNELQVSGESGLFSSAENWEHLPTRGFPMIFHGVSGKEGREDKSPSYFNISEVAEVVNYVEKILDSKFCGQKLRPGDIGVISPYRGQISKIHRALERKRIKGISVGSVEEFQGQERRVIIISTVRSDPLQLQIDQKFRIGFVKEPKRFNVAVTRAKALLIVIGNPFLLETDHNWCYLLRHIFSNGGYVGCKYTHDMTKPLPAPEDHGNQIDSKMQNHFQKLLDANRKVVENLREADTKSAGSADMNSDVDELRQQMSNLNFFTDVGTSAVENYVSPSTIVFEQ